MRVFRQLIADIGRGTAWGGMLAACLVAAPAWAQSEPDAATRPDVPRVQPFERSSGAVHDPALDPSVGLSGPVEFSFNNAPIADVAEVLIGEILGAPYVLDPNLNRRLTLSSAGSMDRSDLPGFLATALRLSEIDLEIQPGEGSGLPTYVLRPIGRGDGRVSAPRLSVEPLAPGDGVVVRPLRYIAAQDMVRLMQPYQRAGGQVLAAEGQNTLVLSGNEATLAAMLALADLFDVDWIRGLSIALVPLQLSNPDVLAEELRAVLGAQDRGTGREVEFIPLPRLQAIVILARNPARMSDARAWIERLDVQPASGRQVRVRRLSHTEAGDLSSLLVEMFSDPAGRSVSQPVIRANAATNALAISATPLQHVEIERVIREFDRAADQVLIEARIVEVVLTDDLEYGVQWFLDTRDGGQATSSVTTTGSVSSRFPGFSYTYASDFVRVALNALSAETEVTTLSSPQIMVRNHERASFQVGDQVPVITQSAVSVADPDAPIVNAIQFRDTGVVLEVGARIDPTGLILLDVVQEVSAVAPTTTSGIDSPTIQQRRLESAVSLQDGQTTLLGGLISSQVTDARSGVPVLQRIPVAGNLFRDTTDNVRRTELLVFLTPRIVRSREDVARVSDEAWQRMEYLRDTAFFAVEEAD